MQSKPAQRKPKKRRTCWDLAMRDARRRAANQPRNPAMSMLVQMLGWTIFVVSGLVPALLIRPSLPTTDVPLSRPSASARVDPFERYPYDPPFSKLMRDLKRPLARQDAVEMLRRRLPAEVAPWLDAHVREENFAPLAMVCRPGRSRSDVVVEALRATLAWSNDSTREGGGGGGGNYDAVPGPKWKP